MKKGCEITYEWVSKLLRESSLSGSASRLGLENAGDGFLIRFLGRTYRVCKDGLELVEQKERWDAGGPDAEYDIKSVLGYYALSKASGVVAGEYCLLGHFSHGIFQENSGMLSMMHKRFAETFGAGPDKLKSVMEKLGAENEPESRPGKHLWRYNLLPKLPVKWVFYEGDEEFPSKLQTLYDKSAIDLFNFEQLAALHSITMRAIISMGRNGPNQDFL